MNQISIEKGPIFKIVFDKKILKSIKATADGIIFNLQNGVDIYNADDRLPRHTKEMMEASLDIINKTTADVAFDLINYNRPYKVTM